MQLAHFRFAAACGLLVCPIELQSLMFSYGVAILELHEFSKTSVLVYAIVICSNAFPVNRSLLQFSEGHDAAGSNESLTSAEHFATASANFSIGLVLPGIVSGGYRELRNQPSLILDAFRWSGERRREIRQLGQVYISLLLRLG